MPLFESPQIAWHDAFTTEEGLQDPYTPKVRGTAAPSGAREVRLAELVKVRKAVMALPDAQRHAGLWAFGPEGEAAFHARKKLQQRAWGLLLKLAPARAAENYEKNYRMVILVVAILEEVRSRANDSDKGCSEAVIASRLGIDRSSFSRTWAPLYRDAVALLYRDAMDGLTAIDPLVQDINRRYQRSGR